jgi:hypothetical protein
MSAVQPHIAQIDAAIVRGEWWRSVFDELSEVGAARVEALSVTEAKGLARVVLDFCRLARAVRLAIVAAMRLDDILNGLAGLRSLGAEAIADVRARARAMAEDAAAAREKARAKREARLAEMGQQVFDSAANETSNGEADDPGNEEREKPALAERDPVVEALDRRLTVDPAGVDFDDLQLRETVLRICADLNITPDWSRWEAGDWKAVEAPPPKPIQTPPAPIAAPRVRPPPLVHGLPDLTPRPTDTAIGLALETSPIAPQRFWPKVE